MKKLLLALLFFGIQFPLLYAQNEMPPAPGGPGHPQPKERISHLKEMLKLNDEQTKKIETIFSSDKKQMEDLLIKQKEEMEKFRSERNKVSENSNNEILNILTEEQKTEFKSFLEERNNRMNDMPPFMGPTGQMMPPQMGRMPHPMGQMMPPQMGQFDGPPMGHRQGRGFMREGRMPPPPGEIKEDNNAQQDKQATPKGKKPGSAKKQNETI